VSKTREFVFGGGTPPPGFILPAINAQKPLRPAFNRILVLTMEGTDMNNLKALIIVLVFLGVCTASLVIGILIPILYLLGIIDNPYVFG